MRRWAAVAVLLAALAAVPAAGALAGRGAGRGPTALAALAARLCAAFDGSPNGGIPLRPTTGALVQAPTRGATSCRACGAAAASCGAGPAGSQTSAMRGMQARLMCALGCWLQHTPAVMPIPAHLPPAPAPANERAIPDYPALINVRELGAKGDGVTGVHGSSGSRGVA